MIPNTTFSLVRVGHGHQLNLMVMNASAKWRKMGLRVQILQRDKLLNENVSAFAYELKTHT